MMGEKQNQYNELAEKLIVWFEKKLTDADSLEITDIQRPGMGLSSETYLLDLELQARGEKTKERMVLRSAPQGPGVFPDYDVGNQYRIMDILSDTEVPVAKMLWLEEDTSILGAPFFIMERLNGEVPQDYPSYHGSGMFFNETPEGRARMWWGTIESMAKIHNLNWEKKGFSFLGAPGNGTDPIDRQLAYWDNFFEWMKDDPSEEHPILQASQAWLKENRYEPEYISLCWGDARMGNTLYGRENREVVAIMDWEMAFIGDPEADLAWSILLDWQHSAGAGLPRLEGTPEYGETVERYQELTGRKVKNLFYNEVFAATRYGMILASVLKKFKKRNIPIEEEMIYNNVCTQRLSELLELPSPGKKREETGTLDTMTVSIQFSFTGPDGYDWYIISDKGKASRYDGTIEDPTCSITVSLDDWKAIQKGELDRLEAWSSGKLVTSGDLNVMVQLEDVIKSFAETD